VVDVGTSVGVVPVVVSVGVAGAVSVGVVPGDVGVSGGEDGVDDGDVGTGEVGTGDPVPGPGEGSGTGKVLPGVMTTGLGAVVAGGSTGPGGRDGLPDSPSDGVVLPGGGAGTGTAVPDAYVSARPMTSAA
jgi:hypothetical protein